MQKIHLFWLFFLNFLQEQPVYKYYYVVATVVIPYPPLCCCCCWAAAQQQAAVSQPAAVRDETGGVYKY